jgi:hypothetical protein
MGPAMNLAFRIVTLSLAILGALVSLIGFFVLRADMSKPEKRNDIIFERKLVEELRSGKVKEIQGKTLAEIESQHRTNEGVYQAVPYLLVGALMMLVGGTLAMCGYPACGSVWLLLGFLGPLILNPRSIVCTFFVPLAFISCLVASFVPKPADTSRPARRPRRGRDDDEDDYDDRDDRRRRGRDRDDD